jgi:hypothetical protein
MFNIFSSTMSIISSASVKKGAMKFSLFSTALARLLGGCLRRRA